jgi:hypothetical protein
MNENGNRGSRRATLLAGILLAAAGVVFLLNNFYDFLFIDRLWPLFMLIPVAVLALAWADKGREASGVVIPIVILTFYAAYFLWLNYTSWANSGTTWPNYLIGPGLAFIAYYFVERKAELLIPAFILLGLASVFYTAMYDNTLIIGGFLVLAGLIILTRGLQRPGKKTGDKEG